MIYWEENVNQCPRAAAKMIKGYLSMQRSPKVTNKPATGSTGPHVLTTSLKVIDTLCGSLKSDYSMQ